MSNNHNNRPLVVDLDGTLIKTDLLIEGISQFLIRYPLKIFNVFFWLLRGRVVLKENISKYTSLNIEALPYNKKLLDWLSFCKKEGRQLVLATASHKLIALQVAEHLNLFDEVIATDRDINLKGALKSDFLVKRFGKDGFDYVGNDWPDVKVWDSAHTAHLVDVSRGLKGHMLKKKNIGKIFEDKNKSIFSMFLKAIRVHQWVKNILIFVPLLVAHQYGSLDSILYAVLAFLIFSLTASSVYLLNDLIDIQNDRLHRSKRFRPFASGGLNLIAGWISWPALLVTSISLTVLLMPRLFLLSLIFYFILTVFYSVILKKIPIIDVISLATLYTVRIVAGAVAIGVPMSFWLLLFSMFLFLSLALIKRYSELKAARHSGENVTLHGRGYASDDLEFVSSLGGSAGFISVLVLALYIQDGRTVHLYATPQVIWLICPVLLFWISRAWLIAHRGLMDDDPIVFALKDKVSWGIGVLMVVALVLARTLS